MSMAPARPKSAYRSAANEGIPVETIVVTRRRHLASFLLMLPVVFSLDDSVMAAFFGEPATHVSSGDGFCGNAGTWTYHPEVMLHIAQAQLVLLCLAIVGAVHAFVSLSGMKRTVYVERAARLLRIVGKRTDETVLFSERPVLIQRNDAYGLHAGARQPIPIGDKHASPDAIARLRSALATLDHIET